MQQATFNRGDIVEFCDERFLVLENHGNSGRVQEHPGGEVIAPFYWSFEGASCVKVDQVTVLL